MNGGIRRADVADIIRLALAEDIGTGDITSQAIFDEGHLSGARIVSKGEGIFCGGDLVRYVYEEVDRRIRVSITAADGVVIGRNDQVAEISGPTRGILAGERTVLNFIQRMSGIATKTNRLARIMAGSGTKILDTRKTLPGFRVLDKYAVKAGSGTNHRMGLYDMVLVKDNHIHAAGGIASALQRVRARYGTRYRVEVEASTLAEVEEARDSGAEIIMLDNMDNRMIKQAIERVDGSAKIEVSGNIDESRLHELAGYGVDFISIGSLTHSVDAFDMTMLFFSGD
jgi:nicotinate-nucleotide pyrophosphorylase (carboxylating)